MMKTFLHSLWILSLIALTACAKPCNGATDTEKNESTQETALDFAQTLGIGWNLGNNLDAWTDGRASETCWGNGKATQRTFDAVAHAGYKSVRIPITWMGHIGPAPSYIINKERMDRVAEVVGYAHKAGLKVIINIHHDGHADGGHADSHTWLRVADAAANPQVDAAIRKQITAVWTQIAKRFKEEGDWLIFETFNEIHDGNWGNISQMQNAAAQFRVLNEWNQTALDAIRSTGGHNLTRYIGVPGYVTRPDLTIAHLRLPTDRTEGRLMVAVHSYDPWDYAGSGKYSEWGHTSTSYPRGEKDYVAMLDNLHKTYIQKGIPVYFGEFACVHRSDERAEAFRKYYLEYVCKAMRDRQIVAFYWDNGYDRNKSNPASDDDVFGLISHSTGEFMLDGREISHIMINAWNSEDPTYTLQQIYDRAPAAKH